MTAKTDNPIVNVADIDVAEVTDCAIAKVLKTSLDELNRHGWKQGGLGTAFGPKCVVGAINWTVYGSTHPVRVPAPALETLRLATLAAIREPLSGPDWEGYPSNAAAYPVSAWNDALGRTKKEITAELRKAIRAKRGPRWMFWRCRDDLWRDVRRALAREWGDGR